MLCLACVFFIVVSIITNISSFVRAKIYSFMATMSVLVCIFFSMAFTIILFKQTRCVIHNGLAINLISTIDIV